MSQSASPLATATAEGSEYFSFIFIMDILQCLDAPLLPLTHNKDVEKKKIVAHTIFHNMDCLGYDDLLWKVVKGRDLKWNMFSMFV